MPPHSLTQPLPEFSPTPARRPPPSRPQAGQTSRFARDLAATTAPPDPRPVSRDVSPGNQPLQGAKRHGPRPDGPKANENKLAGLPPPRRDKPIQEQDEAPSCDHSRCQDADKTAEIAMPALQVDPSAAAAATAPLPLAFAALLAQTVQSQPEGQSPGIPATKPGAHQGFASPTGLLAAPGTMPAAGQKSSAEGEQQGGQEPNATQDPQAAKDLQGARDLQVARDLQAAIEPAASRQAAAPLLQSIETRNSGLMPLALAPAWAPQPVTATPAAAAVSPPLPIQHVPMTIATMASEGTRRFDIRLDPPDLGRIDVTLAVDAEGGIRTHLSVERPETLQLLRQDAHRLDQALSDAGLTADPAGPEFSLRNSGGDDRPRTPQREPAQEQARQDERSDKPPPPAPRLLRTAAARLDLSL